MDYLSTFYDNITTAYSFLLYRLNQSNPTSTTIERHRNYYIVNYNYGDQWYKIKCKQGKKVHIIKITGILNLDNPELKNLLSGERLTNENDANENLAKENDVTDAILEYMGPHMDFHNVPSTPKDFGLKQLTFHLLNHTVKTFEEDELIQF